MELEEAARWNRDREWEMRALCTAQLCMPDAQDGTTLGEMFESIVSMKPGYKPDE